MNLPLDSSHQNSKSILVTGGAGYIGSHTCKLLKKYGFTPVTYDNLSRGHRELVQWGPFVQGDLFEFDKLVETMKAFDIQAVIHFAAYAYISESVRNPHLYFQNNLYGSSLLFNAMKSAGVKSIVFSSTCAVYGESEGKPLTENHPTNPINPYGLSKRMTEQILLKYREKGDLNPCILRYFNAGGADPETQTGEWHEPEPHILPNILRKGRLNEKVQIFGQNYPTDDGTCVRDYIHVMDLAQAHILALKNSMEDKPRSSCIFNLGTGKGQSLLEIIQAAEKVLKKKITYEFAAPRLGDPAHLVASYEKAKSELGWDPKLSEMGTILTTALKWSESLSNK